MNIYLTLYPMEAVIASQLSAGAFGAYMSIGRRKGSAERLIFFELDKSKLGNAVDLDYARQHCVSHSDGRPKNSVYLSVYRALEAVPPEALGPLWLINQDGRGLAIEQGEYSDPEDWNGCALYQELCPAHPLVVSALNPKHFSRYIMGDSTKVSMPAIFFAELEMPSLDNSDFTGNTGGYFDKMTGHLKDCVSDLKAGKGKMTKVVDRSSAATFNYQVIGRGLYAGTAASQLVYYPMPSRDVLKKHHYDWAKSANIF